jgi:hypothetical protein
MNAKVLAVDLAPVQAVVFAKSGVLPDKIKEIAAPQGRRVYSAHSISRRVKI